MQGHGKGESIFKSGPATIILIIFTLENCENRNKYAKKSK